MTPTQSAEKGYKLVGMGFEIMLIKNGSIIQSWWAADFGGKLPSLSHPEIQKAIEREEDRPDQAIRRGIQTLTPDELRSERKDLNNHLCEALRKYGFNFQDIEVS